ncbi:putative DCC family thiol-disulfide oxidoreductase YuxK [Oxalobacteraceae bacterium GrIS 2.11]
MNTNTGTAAPVLLYDGGCATCTRIAQWVQKAAGTDQPGIIVRPVGNDPTVLRALNPGLDIWDAYAVSHVIMPDGSMKLGGEAVAEVFRRLPATRWMAWFFDFSLLGIRPFQSLLNLAYHILDDIRPIFGCESCGRSKLWVRPFERLGRWARSLGEKRAVPGSPVHFRPLPVKNKTGAPGNFQRPDGQKDTK